MMTVEQIVSVQKSNVETLFGLTGNRLRRRREARRAEPASRQEPRSAKPRRPTKAALSVKDAQELLALQASLLQPAAEKAAAYSRYVYEIASTTGAEVVARRRSDERRGASQVHALVDTAVKNAPAGTENAVALVKSAVAAANNALESVQKAAKQAADVAEANFQAMSLDRRPRDASRDEDEQARRRLSRRSARRRESDADRTAARTCPGRFSFRCARLDLRTPLPGTFDEPSCRLRARRRCAQLA